jgi:hypothetical protein
MSTSAAIEAASTLAKVARNKPFGGIVVRKSTAKTGMLR